jgi:hypothetical protein
MDSSFPPDLLDLKARFDSWRLTRSKRAPIPDDLRLAAQALLARYPCSTICRALGLHPRSLKTPSSSTSSSVSAPFLSEPAFFPLPQNFSSANPSSPSRLLLERADGSRLTLTLPAADLASLSALVVNFLRS